MYGDYDADQEYNDYHMERAEENAREAADYDHEGDDGADYDNHGEVDTDIFFEGE